MSVYEYTVRTRDGAEKPLADYKNKVLLIVNTATACGFTPQYEGLQRLYEKYAEKGLEILDFPCNQFARQAPGSDEEIHTFCTVRFGITFPQFAKINVNGKDAAPLYAYLKKQKSGVLGKRIKWNFSKFLIGRDGLVADRFSPTAKPEDLDAKIAALL
jgi:glutathione peroxidase